MTLNSETGVGQVKQLLQSYHSLFNRYSDEIFGPHRQTRLDSLRTQLQRKEPSITSYVLQIVGDGTVVVGSFGIRQKISHSDLLATAVMGGNNELTHNFHDYKAPVNQLINRALGNIDDGLWPPKGLQPVLVMRDEVLMQRCSDLLQSPGKFDRVVREATIILEDRLRNKIPHERLSALIPDSGKQTGDNLVNTLLSASSPILSISTDQRERLAFQKIMLGVFAYLRNPFHHQIDETTEWSWSWSVVGFIDHLLYELESCEELE